MITKVLSKVMGLMLILLGLWIGATVLAFASLIDPSHSEAEWRKEYWEGMATRGGWGGLGMGVVMIAIGGWLVVVPPAAETEVGSKILKNIRDAEIG